MTGKTPIELPEKYYLNYFEYVLAFVSKKYYLHLNKEEKVFIKKFTKLSEDARCLFIRFANRRHVFFRILKLDYSEIADLQVSAKELENKGFISSLGSPHYSDLHELLQIFTKNEILTFLRNIDPDAKKEAARLKKTELMAFIISEINKERFINCINDKEPVIRMHFDKELEMIKFLFFGSIHGDMTQFVVRDIGYIKTEAVDEDKLRPLFKTRKEAEDKLYISKVYETYKQLRDDKPAEEIYKWFLTLELDTETMSEIARPRCDRLALSLGKFLEQQKLEEAALATYRFTQKPPSRERQVRLLSKLGKEVEAVALCEEINLNPQNAEERYFSYDFLNRISTKKRTKSTTDYLKNSPVVELEESYKYNVELGVLNHYLEDGYEGAFTENYLWRSMFGLIFWDIIFDPDSEALHHPLQVMPSDFYTHEFYKKRKLLLHERLNILSRPRKFRQLVNSNFEAKAGTNNTLVHWEDMVLPLVLKCHQKLAPQQLGSVLVEIAKNPRENVRGFPDLFVWADEEYHFIEVKSPNDQLSAQQLFWLNFFDKQGIKAHVARVQWK